MQYDINLDLRIERKQDNCYKVTLLPPSGVEACLCDDILSEKMLADIERLEESFLDDADVDDDDSPCGSDTLKLKKYPRIDEKFLEGFGERLFECLFRGDVRDAYYEAYGNVARNDDRGLRIRLMIDPPEIAVLPWELMFKRKKRRFLSTWEKVSVTRYLKLSPQFGDFDVKKPVGVLVAIPEGSGLDVEKEKNIVREAFRELTDEKQIRLDFVEGHVSDKEIRRQLDEGKPYHVFHFIGHGCFDGNNQDEGYVRLNPDPNLSSYEKERKGKWEAKGWLRADEFADLFSNHPSMQLIILNCCRGAKLSRTKPLAGLAPRLFSRDIPAVVAMQYPIYDDSAIIFSREFYRKLCSRRDFGLLDVAVTHARNSIRAGHRNDLDFATPVLFMNTISGAIFDLDETPDERESTVKPLDFTNGISLPVATASPARPDLISPFATLGLLVKSLLGFVLVFKNLFQNLGRAIYGRLVLLGDQNRLRAVSVAREENLERIIKEEEIETEPAKLKKLAEVRATEEEKLAKVRNRLDKAARLSIRVAAVILVMSVMVYIGAFFGIFNLFWIEDTLQQRAAALSGRTSRVFGDDRIRLIAIQPTVDGPPQVVGEDRLRHARLIEALANAQAKLVVLDLYYEQKSGWDDDLARAIEVAVEKGTDVIVGVNGVKENGKPENEFPPDLNQPLQGRWGNVNVGLSELGSISVEGLRPVVRQVELAKEKPPEPTDSIPPGAVEVAPSLMLEALRRYTAQTPAESPRPLFYPDENLLKLVAPDGNVSLRIPVLDHEMSFMFEPAKEEAIQPFRETIPIQSMDDTFRLSGKYEGRIVIVGYLEDEDLHNIAGGRQMYGMDIHASVLSNIFQERYIKTLGALNLTVLMLMALIGYLLQTDLGRSLRVKVPLELKVMKKTVAIPVPLMVVTVIYFLVMYVVYTNTDYFINMTPHVAVLWISYWVAGWLRTSRQRPLKAAPYQRRNILANN